MVNHMHLMHISAGDPEKVPGLLLKYSTLIKKMLEL